MASSRYLPLLAVLAIASPFCFAQNAQGDSALPNAKPVPEFKEPTPFATDSAPLAKSFTIEERTPDQMAEQDRLREADAESSIAERAGFADLQFNAGKWSYRQLICPDFPNHLFLRFTRDNGATDQSVFTASIPTNGEGHVRIIPILRRSYTLFSPAPINEITIASFNHIRSEEKTENEQSWVGTALCYAALAGADPVAVPVGTTAPPDGFPAARAPMLEVPTEGGSSIHLPVAGKLMHPPDEGEVVEMADAAAKPKPMVWTMYFSKKGRLLKVKRSPDEVGKPTPVPTGKPPAETPVPATIAAN